MGDVRASFAIVPFGPSTRARQIAGSVVVMAGAVPAAMIAGSDTQARRFVRENGLSRVTFGFFLVLLVLQSATGNREYNDEQRQHGEETVGYVQYLGTGHFKESVFENWESEFLQMGAFVVLTVFLRQKGSPESKKFEEEEVDREPRPDRRRGPTAGRW